MNSTPILTIEQLAQLAGSVPKATSESVSTLVIPVSNPSYQELRFRKNFTLDGWKWESETPVRISF